MDLDGDGHKDILTGSWPGELFLFRGQPGGKFLASEMIKDKTGEYINIGGGIREEADSITITGNAEFIKRDGKSFAVYHGKEYESTAKKSISITGTASAVFAADWDDDGDLDLFVGDIGGQVYLIRNEGDKNKYAFGKELKLPVAISSENKEPKKDQRGRDGSTVAVNGDAGPCVADWDQDGDLDLLVGSADGSVSLYQNDGTKQKPALRSPVKLVSETKAVYGSNAPKTVERGTRTKVCVADWNGDGLPDLLVGDMTEQKPDLPDPTPEQKKEHEKLRAEQSSLSKDYSSLVQKLFGSSREKDEQKLKEMAEKFKKLQLRMAEIRKLLPVESETHGWIWYYERKLVGEPKAN